MGEEKTEYLEPKYFIPTEFKLQRKYHCSWATTKAMVWVLIGFTISGQAILQTPKSKKIIYTHKSNLRETNQNAKANYYNQRQIVKKNKEFF